VQVVTTPERRNIRVQTADESSAVEAEIVAVMAELGGVPPSEVSLTSVSPSWGADVTGQAIRALVFFLVAIMIYLTVRLELRMAIGAIVATVHDLLIAVGVYALFQFEITSGTVVAFLMILGYSIYDTVVVFDKIKENEAHAGVTNKLTYSAVASLSMNQVLMRSLNTSITSLIPVVSILIIGMGIMGAATLGQFGIALAVGLLVGTYSSIMVAAPVVVALKEREPRYQQLRERIDQLGGPAQGPVISGALALGADDDVSERADRDRAATPGVSKAAPAVPTATAIPPRPRKKGRKR
jgi:preprotein translocase subunit SecF